ncbi:MAG: bacillithiol biosynthesis deacetylase BshB1 [Sphingobacteriaceae bacterium]
MKLDLLIFAAHPDDAELGCSGTILKYVAEGKKVGIVDLTRGELGTRGTAETRDQEAAEASKILGIQVRENLGMKDGFFQNDEKHQLQIIEMIRKYQPEIVLCNALEDRHPDHGRAAELLNDATFLSGLPKIETRHNKEVQQAWRPRLLLNYIQDRYIKPDVIIDITPFWDQKVKAILAFKTQFFNPDSGEPETYISSPEFLKGVEARARAFGKSIHTTYAEGFTSKKLLGVSSLFELK